MSGKTAFGRPYDRCRGGSHGPDPDLTLLMILGLIIGGIAAWVTDADFATVWGGVVIYGLLGAFLLRAILWLVRQLKE